MVAVDKTGIAVKKPISQKHGLNKVVVYTHFAKGLMTKQVARPGTKTTCPPLSWWLMIMLKLMVLYSPIKILSLPGGYNVAKINEEMRSLAQYISSWSLLIYAAQEACLALSWCAAESCICSVISNTSETTACFIKSARVCTKSVKGHKYMKKVPKKYLLMVPHQVQIILWTQESGESMIIRI